MKATEEYDRAAEASSGVCTLKGSAKRCSRVLQELWKGVGFRVRGVLVSSLQSTN